MKRTKRTKHTPPPFSLFAAGERLSAARVRLREAATAVAAAEQAVHKAVATKKECILAWLAYPEDHECREAARLVAMHYVVNYDLVVPDGLDYYVEHEGRRVLRSQVP